MRPVKKLLGVVEYHTRSVAREIYRGGLCSAEDVLGCDKDDDDDVIVTSYDGITNKIP